MKSLTTERSTHRRDDIQGLRAVAVLAVVFFHAGLPLPGGYLGVDVFFVISGFVICGLISRGVEAGQFQIWGFYSRRIRRLTPALALVSLVVLLVSIPLLSPIDAQRDVAALAIGGATFTSNFVMMVAFGGYFDPQAQFSPLMHLWSLSLEEQFYMIFPFAFVLGAKWRGAKGALIAVTSMAVLSLCTSLVVMSDMGSALPIASASFNFFSPFTRSWEFALGAMALLAVNRWGREVNSGAGRTLLGWLAAGALLFSFLLPESLLRPGLATAAAVLATLILILVGVRDSDARAATGVTRWLSHPLAVWIGALSYSWYLWHWPAAVFSRLLGASPTLIAIFTMASLAPAYLAYRHVEQPIRSGLKVKANAAAILLVCSATTIALAAVVYVGSTRNWGSYNIKMVSQQVEPWFLGIENGCAKGLLPTAENVAKCTWNDSASGRPIYVVGDSDAAMYSDGLLIAAEELDRPLIIMSKPGCPLMELGLANAGLLRQGDEARACAEYDAKIVEWLKSAEPGTVATASAQADEALLDLPVELADPIGQLADAAAEPLEVIRSAGHQVKYMRTMPGLRRRSDNLLWHASTCSGAQLLVRPESCGVSWRMDELAADYETKWAVEERAAQIAKVDYVDLLPAICTDQTCATNLGTFWRYRDATHISVGFSRDLAPQLVSVIKQTDGATGAA